MSRRPLEVKGTASEKRWAQPRDEIFSPLPTRIAFVAITKVTQGLDTTGVAAAAHATTIALWQLGGVILFALCRPTHASSRGP